MSAVVLGTMSIMGVFLIKRGKSTSVSIRYFTTVSQQMLTAIKHVMNDILSFNRTVHWSVMHATQQLLECKTLNFTSFDYVSPPTAYM